MSLLADVKICAEKLLCSCAYLEINQTVHRKRPWALRLAIFPMI